MSLLLLHLSLDLGWPVPPPVAGTADDGVLQNLIDEALENNPTLRAAEEAVAGAHSRAARAGVFPDPMLSLGYQNDGWSPTWGSEMMTFLRIGWSQDLPYPGKRDIRTDIALRDVDGRSTWLERVRLDVVASVKRAYFALLFTRNLLDLLREEESIWAQTEAAVLARYQVGEGSQQDVIRTQMERTRFELRRAELQAEEVVRLAELNGLLGRSVAEPLPTTRALELNPLDRTLEETLEDARRKSPELNLAHIAADRSGLEISLAQKEGKPDFRLGGAYMNRRGLPSMWEIELGINIPLYRDRVNETVAEASAAQREARHTIEAVELVIRSRTEQRYAVMKSYQRIAELYQTGLLPLDRLGVEAGLAGYRTGQVPFVTVLEALGRLYADQAAYLRTLTEHEQVRADLEAVKLDPQSMNFSPSLPSGGSPGVSNVMR